ncbi:uncharacterized protein B4U79_07922 [Dinothrombium tinctorium]|uniref:BAH domain-containing protein n=1 Tax=Dinothrombium tinctorium TaxID=1965070 RepID=A0A3S3PQ38_9ACAR|nr:uncharacterized protein B4U79_13198 [Dinothrombium tinctorium]RWS14261.1 uncharacterized protein B4U79_07922 [Dinothrombium tinctorium]
MDANLPSPSSLTASHSESTPNETNEILTVRVKKEPQSSTSLLSPFIKCATQCYSPNNERNRFQDQIKEEDDQINRDSDRHLIASRFPPVCPPNLEEAQQKTETDALNSNNFTTESRSSSVQSWKTANEGKEREKGPPYSAIVAPLQKTEKVKTINKVCIKEAQNSELLNLSVNDEKLKDGKDDDDKSKSIISSAILLPKAKVQDTNHQAFSESQDQNEGEDNNIWHNLQQKATSKKAINDNSLECKKESALNLKKSKHSKSNSSSHVPVGIAIARKRQPSPILKKPESKPNSAIVNNPKSEMQKVKTQKVTETNTESSSNAIKPNLAINSGTTIPTMTITSGYRLACDAVTGQYYLISTAANFIQSQFIANPSPNISTFENTAEENNCLTENETINCSNVNKVEQATQACLSDEECEQSPVMVSNCVTSSVQVDMDAEDESVFGKIESLDGESILCAKQIQNKYPEQIHSSADIKEEDKEEKETSKNKTSSLCTDGLTLLSALAEQRSLEEKRRHSTDGLSVNDSENDIISDHYTKPVKRKQRSESCISSIDLPVSTSNNSHFASAECGVKKKRKNSNTSDPWMIRRSERIFLNEALQQSQNANTQSSNKSDASQKYKVAVSKKSRKKSKEECDVDTESRLNESSDQSETYIWKELTSEDFVLNDSLLENSRIIIKIDDLLYAGSVSAIQAPDVYGVTLDGERSQNKHIYSREDVLKEAILEKKPNHIKQLPDGTRVCAYWSQQYKCLYPGRVAICSSPNPLPERNLVFVEFDDGDKGRIPLNDIRFLPQNYPICKSTEDVKSNCKRIKYSTEEKVEEKVLAITPGQNENNKNVNSAAEYSEKAKKKRKHCKELKKHRRHHKHKHCKHHKKKKRHKRKASGEDLQVGNLEEAKNEKEKRNETETTVKEESQISSRRTQKRRERLSSAEKSKIAPFLPLQQLWHWSGKSFRRIGSKGKPKKEFYKSIHRGREVIKVGDSAVFLSTGRPNLPYVGKIDSMWQSSNGNMIVKVKWFYHPEETKVKPNLLDARGALFESSHYDENDVQTISHKCEVLRWEEYEERKQRKPEIVLDDPPNVYYMGGTYDPLAGKLQIASKVPLKSVTV